MDWFERLTGISPDGGSGAFEGLLVSAAAAAILAAVAFAIRRTRPR